MNVNLSLVWLRRDLRLYDHAALHKALSLSACVQPVFVFDTDILQQFSNKQDRRLTFIARALCAIDSELKKRGGGLLLLHGRAQDIIPKLAETLGAAHIIAAEDFEPKTILRDQEVNKKTGGKLTLVKDHLIFSPTEITKDDGSAYKVFTPYSRVWRAKLSPASAAPYTIHDAGRYADFASIRQRAQAAGFAVLTPENLLAQIGYEEVALPDWPVDNARKRLADFVREKSRNYEHARDLPATHGTSRISPYLRFGLMSIREALTLAQENGGADKWINELIWREFYAAILYHFPHTPSLEFQAQFVGLPWRQDEKLLAAWKTGNTGYPIIDAAMRELLQTGWMHNRARMIVASFLTKDLLLDWRLGEAHFAQYLMDYELASNVGGWQWAASTGTDAQPWFRIF
ncbi:MAG: deoxyribodipyrimidine photo-lyase, partial [Alphaproteobacteria bacterium]|nr:deoxyribodipyrimidine photo-lyase [Alphaproteobacteria bacterium]